MIGEIKPVVAHNMGEAKGSSPLQLVKSFSGNTICRTRNSKGHKGSTINGSRS